MRMANFTFLVMVIFTFMTFYVGESGAGGLLVSMAVLCVALLKGHLLGDYFMGLAKVHGLWRWIVTIWLLLPAMLIGTAFVLAAR